MRKVIFLSLALVFALTSFSQDFPGYRSGNYSGVNGVFFNPASIAGSPYRFDINLFSVSSLVGNDQLSFKLKDLSKTFNGDSLHNKLFGKDAGPATSTLSTDIHGPSVMFNIGKKTTLAITSRARAVVSVIDLEGRLVSNIDDNLNGNITDLPYTISSSENMRVAINAWSEFGASIGRVLYDEGRHKIKGGLSLKYLSGTGNGYLNINKFRGTIDKDLLAQDAYLTNSSGTVGVGFGGININDLESGDLLKKHGSGIGADLGVEYEFTPLDMGIEDGKESTGYKLKLGLAILDVGKIKYQRDLQRSGDYTIGIASNEKFYLRQLSDVDIDSYNQFFKSNPQYFTPVPGSTDTHYSVSLPTTMQLYADYHVQKGFYLHLGSQIALSSDSKIFNNKTYSAFTLTPRYENRIFSVFVPLNYNSLSKFNAGASFRVGPFFVGSGSILSALLSNSKQVDLHVGVRFGGLK